MEDDIIGKLIDKLHAGVDATLKHPEPRRVGMCLTLDEVDLIVDSLERAYPRVWEDVRIEYISPYKATVAGMLSPDYKERLEAECQQTKIRYEKLKALCDRIEASRYTRDSDSNKIKVPKHDCPFDLLRRQQMAMGEYLHCLEIRAVIEGIELT